MLMWNKVFKHSRTSIDVVCLKEPIIMAPFVCTARGLLKKKNLFSTFSESEDLRSFIMLPINQFHLHKLVTIRENLT